MGKCNMILHLRSKTSSYLQCYIQVRFSRLYCFWLNFQTIPKFLNLIISFLLPTVKYSGLYIKKMVQSVTSLISVLLLSQMYVLNKHKPNCCTETSLIWLRNHHCASTKQKDDQFCQVCFVILYERSHSGQ